MSISTIFANVSCSDLETSIRWYEKLFGGPPTRRPMPRLAERLAIRHEALEDAR